MGGNFTSIGKIVLTFLPARVKLLAMKERYLGKICFDPKMGRQMRFIAGPRQVGKTTLAKSFLKDKGCFSLYYNWDTRAIRVRYKEDPYFYNADALKIKSGSKKWICFDEIHKYPKWKDILKDTFDSFENKYHFIVTGSARLDLFRKAGDSLSGRYFLFRLLPISLFELSKQKFVLPTETATHFIESNISNTSYQKDMDHLIHFSGFPEPLIKGNDVFNSNWHEAYIDTLLREDLRDLTKIHELENVITLMHLLPERVGSPLSLNSLRENLEVSYNAIRSYIRGLTLTYIIFHVSPYSKKISRSIKKEGKVYFYDWTQVKDEANRFENYIACELKHRTSLWTMTTKYKFDLNFVRTRDSKETDFLITRDCKPFFLVEVKLSSDVVESHNRNHANILKVPLIQLVQREGVLKAGKDNVYVISASNFLG